MQIVCHFTDYLYICRGSSLENNRVRQRIEAEFLLVIRVRMVPMSSLRTLCVVSCRDGRFMSKT